MLRHNPGFKPFYLLSCRFIPQKHKDVYLTYILNQLEGNSFMVFCNQCHQTMRVASKPHII